MRQGKYVHPYVRDDEECRRKAWEWVYHMLLWAEGRGAGCEIVEVTAMCLDTCISICFSSVFFCSLSV